MQYSCRAKYLFMNETKQNKIWPRPKGLVQKIFQTLLPNFSKGHDESCQKFHPFCMAWMKVSKMHQIFNEISN